MGILYFLGSHAERRLYFTEYFSCLLLQHNVSLPHSGDKRLQLFAFIPPQQRMQARCRRIIHPSSSVSWAKYRKLFLFRKRRKLLKNGWLARLPLITPHHPRPGSLAPNIGDHGPSDSALAASSGWRLRRPAADRHAARYASRDLCSGARHSAPCALDRARIPPVRRTGGTSASRLASWC